jgi:hypothetical protein
MIVFSTTYSLIKAKTVTGRFLLPLYPTDSAALSDTLLFVMSLPLADSVAASDVLINDIVVAGYSDALVSSDALILSMTNSATDSMSAADVLGIFVQPGLDDTALGSELITVSSSNVLSTGGTATDALGAFITIPAFTDGLSVFDLTGIRVNDSASTEWYITRTDTAAVSEAGEGFIESYVDGHTYFAERYVGETFTF